MKSFSLFLTLNQLFAAHKRVGFLCVGLILAAGLVGLARLRPAEDIASMIPDDGSGLAEDFRLIQKAPFTNRVFIDISCPPGDSAQQLVAAGDALAQALDPNLFLEIRSGPHLGDPAALVLGMLDLAPALFTENDLLEARKKLSPEAVRQALRESLRTLSSTEGLGMKEVIRRDPLGFRQLTLSKLVSLRLSNSLRLEMGRFISEDGRHMLVMARPVSEMTDSKGAYAVMDSFERAKTSLPPGYTATLTGGYRHTQANTTAIKSDLSVVLLTSSAGLALVFLIFLRSSPGFLAMLLPMAILPPAAVLTKLVFGSISGITLGFGSVLMGVAADYSIYVYFALRTGHAPAQTALQRVVPPVWYGAATSLISFAALLFSAMPGVRELAFFSVVGLTLALFLALVVLPCLITHERGKDEPSQLGKALLSPRQALVLTVLALAAGLYWGQGVGFDSDLRSLSASGAAIKRDEDMTRRIWGGLRERSMVFAKGASLDEALTANQRFYASLHAAGSQDGLINLAPILPPAKVQAENIARWRALFSAEHIDELRKTLESEAEKLGFTPEAFAPFWALLANPVPELSTPEKMRAIGLGDAVELLLARDGKQHLVISLAEEASVPPSLKRDHHDTIRFVSQSQFAKDLTAVLKVDFLHFILLAFGGNIILLYVFLRSLPMLLLSLLPTAVGLAFLFGVMGIMDMQFNLFGVIAVPLLIGIGVDYGIFMAMEGAGSRDGATMRAVVSAGLTTLAGFGALVLARHPALHSIGLTVLIGTFGAVLACCLLVAPLGRKP